MWPDVTIDVEAGPVRGIPVPATAVDVTVLTGDGYLCGFAFRESAGEIPATAEGSVTSPAAGGIICGTGPLAAGTYDVSWIVSLAGTLAAVDANNMRIADTAGNVLESVNPAVAGDYPQESVRVTIAQTNTLFVSANALATVGAIYSASLSAVPVSVPDAVVEMQDGSNPLGELSIVSGGADSEWFGPQGIRISQQIKVHIVQGGVTGVVYARFIK